MKSGVDRLLEELDRIQNARGSIEPLHPRFTSWVSAVRDHLSRQPDLRALKRFERLKLARTALNMWHREELSPPELREFTADLDQIAEILAETRRGGKANGNLPAENSAGERLAQPPLEPADGNGKFEKESAMEQKAQQSREVMPKQSLPEASRTRVIEKLLVDLKQEMTKPNGDLASIQRIMGYLLELKKTGDLVDRLESESAQPGATWESVRDAMAQLWSMKKEVLIELMPSLLQAA